jgi:small-conductance mechanosensitive channel
VISEYRNSFHALNNCFKFQKRSQLFICTHNERFSVASMSAEVLDEIVYSYSWPLFPYIWNEIKFYVAYNADLEFIARTMQRVTEEELGEEMMRRVETFRDLLARTPVDELEVCERPRVFFRPNENTWLEAIVRYLVAPREAGRVKNRLIKKLLAALNAAPEKVMFPAGAAR